MKKLTLNSYFEDRLNRAQTPIGAMTYLGRDLSSYTDTRIVAIVGTRKPSPYGIMVTKQYAEALTRAGVVVVSGLALGIDGIAHQAAVAAGGKTIAVLPSGVDTIYPASHRPLAAQIVKTGGTLISEYPAGHKPFKIEYLERNRIIAAISDVVIIPEAAAGSGSLNTAMHAREAGVPVYVLPGNITNPMSAGTNQLLVNHQACATTDPADILQFLQIDKKKQLSLDLNGETAQETIILQKINQGHSAPHDLQKETQLATTNFQTAITMLEIQGRIGSDTAGNWHLK